MAGHTTCLHKYLYLYITTYLFIYLSIYLSMYGHTNQLPVSVCGGVSALCAVGVAGTAHRIGSGPLRSKRGHRQHSNIGSGNVEQERGAEA